MDAVRTLREDVMAAFRTTEEKAAARHQELLDLIRAQQGPTSQRRMDGPASDDPPFDDHGGAFTPTGTGWTDPGTSHGQPRTTDTVSDPQDLDATAREDVGGGTQIGGDTETAVLEQVLPEDMTTVRSAQLLDDPVQYQELTPIHFQEVTPDPTSQRDHPVDPGVQGSSSEYAPPVDPTAADLSSRPLVDPPAADPSIRPSVDPTVADPSSRPPVRHFKPHRSIPGDQQGTSSSSHHIGQSDLDRTPPPPPPPPLRRGNRIRERGWMERSPYTDPCRPKRAWTMPRTDPPHEWNPHGLVDPDQLAAYMDYKRSVSGEL